MIRGVRAITAAALALTVTTALAVEAGRGEPAVGARVDRALVIGTDRYLKWAKLENAVADAKALAEVLEGTYGFKVDRLADPTYAEVRQALERLQRTTYGPDDQLLVFIAGHGAYDAPFQQGYVAFRDSDPDPGGAGQANFAGLKNLLEAVPCQHVLLVLDTCFSGTFDDRVARRGLRVVEDQPGLRGQLRYRTRQYVASVGKESASDGRPGEHSPFMRGFLGALRSSGAGVVTLDQVSVRLAEVRPPPLRGSFGTDEPGSGFAFAPRQGPSAPAPRPEHAAPPLPEWLSRLPQVPGWRYAVGISSEGCTAAEAAGEADRVARAVLAMLTRAEVQSLEMVSTLPADAPEREERTFRGYRLRGRLLSPDRVEDVARWRYGRLALTLVRAPVAGPEAGPDAKGLQAYLRVSAVETRRPAEPVERVGRLAFRVEGPGGPRYVRLRVEQGDEAEVSTDSERVRAAAEGLSPAPGRDCERFPPLDELLSARPSGLPGPRVPQRTAEGHVVGSGEATGAGARLLLDAYLRAVADALIRSAERRPPAGSGLGASWVLEDSTLDGVSFSGIAGGARAQVEVRGAAESRSE